MTLLEKQVTFALKVSSLISQAFDMGYEVTLGEAVRPLEVAEDYAGKGIGIKKSLHCIRLAIDLNLFKDGKYLDKTEDHKPLGEWWEKQSGIDFKCCWGGRFNDGNHYSIELAGVK